MIIVLDSIKNSFSRLRHRINDKFKNLIEKVVDFIEVLLMINRHQHTK